MFVLVDMEWSTSSPEEVAPKVPLLKRGQPVTWRAHNKATVREP